MNLYCYTSKSVCPWHNLAVEEYLLLNLPPQACILYLYQNEKTVVIGKNQNAWKECRHALLESEGGRLARRISGDGAVYHDIGNLNFSFIVSRTAYDLKRQLRVILGAVRALNIDATFTGRNDILSGGAKFSGNAFCFKTHSAFHHGTILVNTDMTQLERYLCVPADKIVSKGVESVRARVCNLSERNPAITVEAVADALKYSFARIYGPHCPLDIWDEAAIAQIEARNASWEWRIGRSPRFDIETGARFSWGRVDFCLSLRDGVITAANVYSDALDADLIDALPGALTGSPLRADSLAARLEPLANTNERRAMVRDMADFFKAY